jgi:hypothetical protein
MTLENPKEETKTKKSYQINEGESLLTQSKNPLSIINEASSNKLGTDFESP